MLDRKEGRGGAAAGSCEQQLTPLWTTALHTYPGMAGVT